MKTKSIILVLCCFALLILSGCNETVNTRYYIDEIENHIEVDGKIVNDYESMCKFIKKQCGYISFSKDYYISNKGKKYLIEGCKIPTMWAYYAKSNKGVCIAIDEEKFKEVNKHVLGQSWLKDVQYKRFVRKDEFDVKRISPEEIIKKYNREIFFYKQKSWAHERERRLCVVYPPNDLSINNCIVNIILGSRFEISNMLKIASIIEDSNSACHGQLSKHHFLLQSNVDGFSSVQENPFLKLKFELERVNNFLT